MFGYLFEECWINSFSVFIISFLIAFLLSPLLWKFSNKRGYTAAPNHRSSHEEYVPNIGGIMLFFSISLPLIIFSDIRFTPNFILILIAFLSLFIVGVLDDLKNVSVKYKLIGQFIPAFLILLSLYHQNLIIPFIENSAEWPDLIKYLFWIIVIVGIVNAYNFIDGIDGLAISLGIIGGGYFGVYFYLNGYCNLSLLAFSFSGGLVGLLKQNVSSKKKIFIGDTGSLIIGGVISLFILRKLEISQIQQINYSSSMIFGITFIPVSDLIRIVISRVINKKSPFTADRNHVHHVIMDVFNLSHRRTSAYLIIVQGLIILLFYFYNQVFEVGQLYFSCIMFLIYVGSISQISKRRRK